MMEEIGDDTNGESTFEFVGDKSDENVSPTGLVTTVASGEKIAVSVINEHTTVSSVMNSNVKDLSASLTVTASSILPPPQPAPFFPAVPIPQRTDNTISSSLYYPSRPISSILPESSYSPSISTAAQSPIATVTQPTSVVSIPSATVDLPIDEFSSSSNMTPQEGNGMWGWLTGSDLLNKVAEKAKSSVDSMIATLDPGMKEIIYSGGDVNIIVASDKEVKISPVREAFQHVFGKATVQGFAAQSCNIAAQPVGFAAGLKAAEERILTLRHQGLINEHQPIVAIENFLVELTPDRWYDMGCLVLQDPSLGLTLHTYSQATPVPTEHVIQAQEQTSSDYPLRWSGLSVTIGQIMSSSLGISRTEWHQSMVGISRREMLLLASKSLAGMYKNYLNR